MSESTGVGVEENSFHLSQMTQILAKLYMLQLNHSNGQVNYVSKDQIIKHSLSA